MLKLFGWFCCILLLSNNAWAVDNSLNAKQILEATRSAMDRLNYQGTIAVYKLGELDAMKLYHSVENGIEQERITTINSPIREVVLQQGELRCEYKESKQLVTGVIPSKRSLFLDLPDSFEKYEQFYTYANAGSGMVAQIPAYIIDIKPKDGFRYARKVWVSQEYYLPLKFVLLDKSGAALEQSMFIDLQVGQAVPAKKIENKQSYTVQELEVLSFKEGKTVLNKIPPGFEQVFFVRRKLQDQDKLIDHILLSDGFSNISVYLEQFDEEVLAGDHFVGAVNSFSRKLGQYMLTVMGEVPFRSVKFIADGAVLKESHD